MKTSPQLRILPALVGGLGLADVNVLLDQIPQAAFLISPATNQILLANQSALELCGWTNPQLQNASLRSVFPDLPVTFAENHHQAFICHLLTASGTALEGSTRLQALPKRSQWSLLLFSPSESSLSAQPCQPETQATIWQALDWAVLLLLKSPADVLLARALENLKEFTASENGFLYTAHPNRTHLTRVISLSTTAVLPSRLPAKALSEVASPAVWRRDLPATSHLARIAQERGQGFLIALPLGESAARVGLILLCGRGEYRPAISLEGLIDLSRYLSALVQLLSQIRGLEKELSLQSHENAIHRRLLNSIQEGVLLINASRRVLVINSAAETILGYTGREVLGQNLESFLIGNRDLSPLIQSALEGKLRLQARSVHLYRRTGQPFLADLQLIPLYIDQRVTGVAILIQDRTEQETLLTQSMRMEQRALLGEFTTLFAHEARNPLNNIMANLQWMSLNLPENDPNQAILQRIQQNCERLNGLMDTILTYNRISEMELESVEVQTLMKKILDRQSLPLQQANIHVNYEAEGEIPAIRGNRRALERVFTNLIDNAIYSMKERGGSLTVKVRLSRPKESSTEWLEISIADSGPGIAEEYKEKLFKESFTTKPNGTGIGLLICRKIIQAHQGSIDYQSIPGGTVFIVRLPLNQPESFCSPKE
ncbi:MAG: ATP-binding protein [Anaerolineales bacterium]|nr:ATP-binding protein [Anaerolineales bacterium]MCS7247795.1 ATP-binding protein [Anaerolineales bacterium]MDW8161605.1 ATP-binding protein [Anaerolineales bacterium]MDW8448342.1 ATP-binding protein [Anaerolineales bacterium]